MSAEIIQFPTRFFFVEKCDFENPFDIETIKLESRTRDAAQREADAIAEHYGWSGWVVWDETKRVVTTQV